MDQKKSSSEARPAEIETQPWEGDAGGGGRRGTGKEQLISLKASGTSVQRRGRVCSTAVDPSLGRYFPHGVIFPVSIFRKEFACLLSPANASERARRKPQHMLEGFSYQVLQALFKHASYPLGLVGPLVPRAPDDLAIASAVNFKRKKKVNVTKSNKVHRELKRNRTPPPPHLRLHFVYLIL